MAATHSGHHAGLGVGIWQGAKRLRGSAWRLQKQHPPWASQSDGFMNDAKCPKPTESEQGAPGCCTLRGQQCGPHRKKEPLQIRAVPTPSPCPHPSFLSRSLSNPTDPLESGSAWGGFCSGPTYLGTGDSLESSSNHVTLQISEARNSEETANTLPVISVRISGGVCHSSLYCFASGKRY